MFKIKLCDECIFIKGNIPSSKNSKQWTGKLLIKSKTVRNYDREFGYQWVDPKNVEQFKRMIKHKIKPYKIAFYFIRNTKRKFDYVNVAQYPLDLMVKNDWLDDDNSDEIVPIFLGYKIDKHRPGLIIKIFDSNM